MPEKGSWWLCSGLVLHLALMQLLLVLVLLLALVLSSRR